MTTRIMYNGMKVHFVHPDGTHYKEGEKFPREMQEKIVRAFYEHERIQKEKEDQESYFNNHT
ncbi:hypothetical protein ACSFB8_04280 [Enterococcus faecalis]